MKLGWTKRVLVKLKKEFTTLRVHSLPRVRRRATSQPTVKQTPNHLQERTATAQQHTRTRSKRNGTRATNHQQPAGTAHKQHKRTPARKATLARTRKDMDRSVHQWGRSTGMASRATTATARTSNERVTRHHKHKNTPVRGSSTTARANQSEWQHTGTQSGRVCAAGRFSRKVAKSTNRVRKAQRRRDNTRTRSGWNARRDVYKTAAVGGIVSL